MEKLKNRAVVALVGLFLWSFGLWSLIKPPSAVSVSERRPLAAFPELTAGTLVSGEFMSGFETYAADQFPLRENFRRLKAVTAFQFFRQRDNNGIYIADGYAAALEYPMDEASIQYAADRFRLVYDKYLAGGDSAVYLSVIPDKSCFLAEANGIPAMDYGAFAAAVRSRMEYAAYIDIMPLLELGDYYRTDIHWRQEKITDVAGALAAGMGVSLTAEYTERQAEAPFYGVYYGQSALPLPADTLCYLVGPALESLTVYDYETGSYIPVHDLTKTEGNDPYEMFLGGSKSLLVIENPEAATGRELLLFRDSFGSSIAPLLADGYAKITLIDIRYISPNLLDRFITFDGQDVLFLYSVPVLNNSETIK